MKTVRLRYVGPGAVQVYDNDARRGLVLERGAEADFSELCAIELCRDVPDNWELVEPPQPAAALPKKAKKEA